MSLTGYVARNGNDLSLIFQSGNSGLTTGYKLTNGQDIGSIFAIYASIPTQLTGLVNNSGADISTLFNGKLAFSPLSISGCCLWLDAADVSTISKDANNKVSNWADKSTKSFQFAQTTANYKPTYTPNNQNGNATLAFNSTNATYLMGPSDFAIGTLSYALFAVCSYTNDTDYGTIFAKALYGAQTGRIMMTKDNSGFSICYTHTTGNTYITIASYTLGAYRLLELIVNRTEGYDYIYQNGTQLSALQYADTTNYTASSNVMLVGAYNNGSGTGVQPGYFHNGNIAEIIAYNSSDMSTLNREKVEGYLAWKWGIVNRLPTNHTYKNAPPT